MKNTTLIISIQFWPFCIYLSLKYMQKYEQDLAAPFICIYHKPQKNFLIIFVICQCFWMSMQQVELLNIWEKLVIYLHCSPCIVCLRPYAGSHPRFCQHIQVQCGDLLGLRLVGCWEAAVSEEEMGSGMLTQGENLPGLFKRLLLEFNHPAILDTLWSWEGRMMSKQHKNCKNQLIQKLQLTLWMDECNLMLKKQNNLWK